MSDDELPNPDILLGIFREIADEEVDSEQRTKNLITFMMTGKETFNFVIDLFRGIDYVKFYQDYQGRKRKISCHVKMPGMYLCDLPDLPDILLRTILKHAKSMKFSDSLGGFRQRLRCLAVNGNLKTVSFSTDFDFKVLPRVFRHVKHIDNVTGPFEVFQGVVAMKLDVGSIFVSGYFDEESDLFNDLLIISPCSEFTGLKRLQIDVSYEQFDCAFERQMNLFNSILEDYQVAFPVLEMFEFIFAVNVSPHFKSCVYNFDGLKEQISIIENNLKSFTGRPNVVFDCRMKSRVAGNFEQWTVEMQKQFPDYVKSPNRARDLFEFTKTTKLLPSVELKLSIFCLSVQY